MRAKLILVAVCLLAQQTDAEIFTFNDGGVHDVFLSGYWDQVVVDSPPPAVGFTTVNLSGTGATVKMYSNSQVTLDDGFYYAHAYGNSQLTANSADGDLFGYDNSQVTVNGGGFDELVAYGSSQVTMNDGSPHTLAAHDNSQLTINGGGGQYGARAFDNSRLTVNGGVFSSVNVSDNGHVTVTGGELGGLGLDPGLGAWDDGHLIVYGSDFAIYGRDWDRLDGELIFSGYGTFTRSSFAGWDWVSLRGTLPGGAFLDAGLYIGDAGQLSLVPLPGAVLLGVLGLGVAGWRLRRRTY